MEILLTNDDGYEATGLHAAYEALRGFGRVHVVAPKSEKSACSNSITLRQPITVETIQHEHFGKMFAVHGTPADCVRLAFGALLEHPIDVVVSGINHGANAGVDIFYSGTVAGAREGAILGVHSIALSQALRSGTETNWEHTTRAAQTVLRDLLEERLAAPGFFSVNFPAPIPERPEKHLHRVPAATHPMPMTFDRSDVTDNSKVAGGPKATDGSKVRGGSKAGEGSRVSDGRLMQFNYGASYWLREVSGPSDYSVIRDGGIAITTVPLFGRF